MSTQYAPRSGWLLYGEQGNTQALTGGSSDNSAYYTAMATPVDNGGVTVNGTRWEGQMATALYNAGVSRDEAGRIARDAFDNGFEEAAASAAERGVTTTYTRMAGTLNALSGDMESNTRFADLEGRALAQEINISFPEIQIQSPEINVSIGPEARQKFEAEMEAYGINPNEVTLTTDTRYVSGITKLAWQVTDGTGGVRTVFRDSFAIAMAALELSSDLITLHEEDHIARLNAAKLSQIVNAPQAGLIVIVNGRTAVSLEYLANRAAINAARSMEPSTVIQNTVKSMNMQNDNYLRRWILSPKSSGPGHR